MESLLLEILRTAPTTGIILVVLWYGQDKILKQTEVSEAWEYATSFDRLDPFIVAAGLGLEKTDEEVDQIFQLAVTL